MPEVKDLIEKKKKENFFFFFHHASDLIHLAQICLILGQSVVLPPIFV